MNTSEPSISLSVFFPENTTYFYGYPAGLDSSFMNLVSPAIEELVAARPNGIAGDNLKVINFHSTDREVIGPEIMERLGLDTLAQDRILKVPDYIDELVTGKKRNELIKNFLLENVEEGSLVVAQPFLDSSLRRLYSIDPQITVWLNDKINLPEIMGGLFSPANYGKFKNGQDFVNNLGSIKSPCVIKATSSSSGDGVYICRNEDDLLKKSSYIRDYTSNITVEELVDTKNNYGIHFGITPKKEIRILGATRQITTDRGAFMGGLVESTEIPEELRQVVELLKKEVLPKVADMGWFGVGGIDVLTTFDDRPYVIDANFRMTGMTAFLYYYMNHPVRDKLLAFTGFFVGDENAFREKFVNLHEEENMFKTVSASRNKNLWRFNSGILFRDVEDLLLKANLLRSNKIESSIFEHIEEDTFIKSLSRAISI